MPVAVAMPNQQKPSDPLEKLANAVSIAKSIYGIHADSTQLDLMRQQKEEQTNLTGLQAKGLKNEQAGIVTGRERANLLKDLEPAQEGEKGAFILNSTNPDGTVLQEFVRSKKGDPKPVDPLAEELRMQRLADMKTKRENADEAKTPKGRLNKMGADQKGRFDNVVLGIDALTGMEQALANGSNTFSLVGDNDFTRNEAKWSEAIGRMQSGGAINVDEAKRFKKMIPGVSDSSEQQKKKLADMRALMEQRFGTFGFDKSAASDLGLDPSRMGWQGGQPAQAPPVGGVTHAGTPVSLDKVQQAAAAELNRRRSQVRN